MDEKDTGKIVPEEQNRIEKSAEAEKNAPARFSLFKKNDKKNPVVAQIDVEEVLEDIEKQEEYKLAAKEAEEKIQGAEAVVKKQKSKKKKILSLVMMLINIGVVIGIVVTMVQTDNAVSLSTIIKSSFHVDFFLLAILFFFLMALFDGLKIDILIMKMTKRSRFFLSYKTGAIGRYYDCITPFATGGQPFQVLYLKNRGLKTSQAIAAPLGKYVFFKIAHVVFSGIVIFSTISNSRGVNGVGGAVVSAASWIGFSISFLLIFVVILLAINRKAGSKCVGGVVKLLFKMKIVKNYEKTYNQVIGVVDDFQNTIKFYVKSPATFIFSLLAAFAALIVNYTIPFFVYSTFAGFNPEMWSEILVKCVMIDLAAGFIPLPGGTGMTELSFSALFASLFVDGTLFWALLFWRILTYYGYIFQGLGIIVYDYFVGQKRYDWQSKKESLQKESKDFCEQQLKEFDLKRRKKPHKGTKTE